MPATKNAGAAACSPGVEGNHAPPLRSRAAQEDLAAREARQRQREGRAPGHAAYQETELVVLRAETTILRVHAEEEVRALEATPRPRAL